MRDLSADTMAQDEIEIVEKISLRLVVQAIVTFGTQAWLEFRDSPDKEQDIAQDIVRDALDEMAGFSRRQRVLGTVDYRRARWLPTPFGLVPQALCVDAKASLEDYRINLQLSQISMRPVYWDKPSQRAVIREPGVPTSYPFTFADRDTRTAISTTIFVQMVYKAPGRKSSRRLLTDALVVAIPNGKLEQRYAPSAEDTIWRAGKHSPRRGEEPRTRISVEALREKALWRVQRVTWTRIGKVTCSWSDVRNDGTEVAHRVVADAR